VKVPCDARVVRLRGPATLWRQLRRQETPCGALASWRPRETLAVLVLCLLVALVSSWPQLVEPNLAAGLPAPFTARAPKNATVIDLSALEQRRLQIGLRTQVLVVDDRANADLRTRLERQLHELERRADSQEGLVGAINLSRSQERWLRSLSVPQRRQWAQTLRLVQGRMLSQGLNASVAEEQLRQAAYEQLEGQGEGGRSLGSQVLARSLVGQTNLRTDARLSQRRIEQLITQQGIPSIRVLRGDLITRQGEPITPQAFDVLDYFGLVNRSPQTLDWALRFGEALVASGLMVLLIRRWRPSLEPRHALLVLGALLLVQGVNLWLGEAASPLVLLVPMTLLLAQGLGTATGLGWLAAAAMLWSQHLPGLMELRLLMATAVAGTAALLAGRQRNRAELLELALLLPSAALVLQWLLIQGSGLISGGDSRLPSGSELLNEALLMGGLLMAWLLIAPLVESFFGLLTRARLLELADLERPLLRRLSQEAPGTFEHTLMIASLAEEGTRTIAGDTDLVRTGALYHDVGKLHGPQWFIENQTGDLNPHDTLDDPHASARILQAHVDEGLKLARRYRLPRPLADFIPEHQGTLKMGYFLHRARELDPTVAEAQFRYRGPAPRSRETAILMLADGCEAALRALPPNTSEAEARSTVQRIIEARQQDGQLSSSGLSRAELDLVTRAFVRVWKRMRHRRIPYPISPRKAYSA
jgi:putative nucleotidyltransferase with HDIG domain